MTATATLPTTAAELAAQLAANPPQGLVDPPVVAALAAEIGELAASEMHHAAAQIAFNQRAATRTAA